MKREARRFSLTRVELSPAIGRRASARDVSSFAPRRRWHSLGDMVQARSRMASQGNASQGANWQVQACLGTIALLLVACGGAAHQPRTEHAKQAEPEPAAAPAQVGGPAPSATAPVASASPETPPVTLAGRFRGRIWSGGELMPAETFLSLTPSGGTGNYTFTQDGNSYTGTLSDCVPSGARFSCSWRDAWGSGTLEIEARPDGRGFEGEWWPEGDHEDKHPWFGVQLDP